MGWPELTNAGNVAARECMGEAVTYRPAAGGAYPLRALFSEDYESIDADTGVLVSTQAPNIFVRLADLQAFPSAGDQFDYLGRRFVVERCDVDGEGTALLIARRVAT